LDKDDVPVVQELLDGLAVVSVDNLKALLEQSLALPASAVSVYNDAAPLRIMLAAHVLRLGVSRLLQFVPKPLLRTLSDAAQVGSGGKAAHELERVMGRGLRRFLHERLDVSALRALCVALGVEGLARDAAREASQREQQIADEVMLMGAESALLAGNVALLRVLAKELQLDSVPSGAAQEALADSVMAAIFNLEPLDKKKLAHKQRQREEEQEKRERPGRKKTKRGKSRYKAPPLSNIKRGITKQELHDLYNFTDLQEYCKEHELDYTGKKALLMRRIIAFLETGDKGTVKVPRKRKVH
jgi:hypothetical protein